MTDETSLEDAEHTQICVDPETQERVEDDECDNGGSSGGRWFYGSSSYPAPKVGAKVDTAHFSTAKPASTAIAKVPRGGFGGHGGGGS